MSPTKVSSVTLSNGKTVPVVYVKPEDESPETKKLRKVAADASAEAIRKAHAHGLSITVVQDNEIVQIAPDGTRTVLGTL